MVKKDRSGILLLAYQVAGGTFSMELNALYNQAVVCPSFGYKSVWLDVLLLDIRLQWYVALMF